MSEEVLITVMLPVYENINFFRRTIKSLFAQKEVDFQWNIMILDWRDDEKAETESVLDIVDDKKVFYCRCNNVYRGYIWECVNYGAEISRAEWISVITNPYIFLPDYIRYVGNVIKLLKHSSRKRVGVISTQYKSLRVSIDDGSIERIISEHYCDIPDVNGLDKIGYLNSHIVKALGVSKIIIPENAALYCRDIFLETGGYDTGYDPVETDVLFMKILEKYDAYILYKECGMNFSLKSIYGSKDDVIMAAKMWREYVLLGSGRACLKGIDKYAYYRFIRRLIQRHKSMRLTINDFKGVMPEKISVTRYLFYYYYVVHYYEKRMSKKLLH